MNRAGAHQGTRLFFFDSFLCRRSCLGARKLQNERGLRIEIMHKRHMRGYRSVDIEYLDSLVTSFEFFMCPRLLFHDFSAPPKNRGTWWMLFAKRWEEGAGLAQPPAIGGIWGLAAFWPIRNWPSRSGYCPRLFSAALQKWEKNGFYATHGGSRKATHGGSRKSGSQLIYG